MSLSNLLPQILEARFQLMSSGSSAVDLTIDIQNESLDIVPVYWNNTKDVALSGTKRSNIRDLDMVITLDYDASLEPDKIRQLFNALTVLDSNDYELRFYPNADLSDYIEVIPSDGLSLIIEYDNTVRKGGDSGVIPTLVFEAKSYEGSIGEFFQTST